MDQMIARAFLVMFGVALSMRKSTPKRNLPVATNSQTVNIAPGIDMPMMSFGIVKNHSVFIGHGGRGLDTGLVYTDTNEAEVGTAIQFAIDNQGLKRSDLFLIDKIPCCPTNFPDGICDREGPRDPAKDIEHDLRVINVTYVDLMLLHWPCKTMEETVAAYKHIEAMKADGKARSIGVSNFNASFLEEFVKRVDHKPVVNQVGYSIAGHSLSESAWGRDEPTYAKAQELGIQLMAFSPLAAYTQVYSIFKDQAVKDIGAKYGKSSGQVALRWLLQQRIPLVTRTDNEDHVVENLQAFDFELDSDDMTRLTAIQPPTCLTENDPTTVAEGERDSCQNAMLYAKTTGILQHPDWYPGLTSDSSWAEIQTYFATAAGRGASTQGCLKLCS